jgi:DNA-binding transcriptional LysR family regulator
VLLHRLPRGVVLTPAGRAAVVHARVALAAAASSVRAARSTVEGRSGSLRLACAQSLTVGLVAPVVRDWHERRPEVSVVLHEAVVMGDALGLLERDEVDLVLVPGPVPDAWTVTDLVEEEVVLSAATDHPWAERSVVRLTDLDGCALVHFATDNSLSAWLDQSLARAGVQPVPVVRTSVTSTAPQLAAAGLGVAVTPLSAVGDGFPGVVRPFEPRWTRRLVAVTAAEPDPLVARFVADVRRRGLRVPRAVRTQLIGDDDH